MDSEKKLSIIEENFILKKLTGDLLTLEERLIISDIKSILIRKILYQNNRHGVGFTDTQRHLILDDLGIRR